MSCACSQTSTTEDEKLVIDPSISVGICFLPDRDLRLGDKLRTVLSKRKSDVNFYVVEEFPYISAHDDPKGDRVYRSFFQLQGRRVDEELNFTDSILVSYSAAYVTKNKTKVLRKLACDLPSMPSVFSRDTSISFQHKNYGNEVVFEQHGETTRVTIVYFLNTD
ncbi:hypothetical protein DQQ10_06440 [Pseudochryseolinea flava]|uniref:Uncharacterized protein n=2 Tax=Pseudochryseolinea flava TaxID=2059302 RepID=A0A364Y5A3_9BACT|nr:hypothetical protein DQQ10_06440 [Pseudochryseolinea flava]